MQKDSVLTTPNGATAPGPESPADMRVRRILIYRLGSLGDTVVALPCLHLLARTYPDAERFLLTNFSVHAKAPASAAVLGDSGLVHGYLRYTVGTRNPGKLCALAREIRRFHPDLLVYLSMVRGKTAVRRDHIFFRWLCGISRIAGLPGKEEIDRCYGASIRDYRAPFDASSGLYEAEAARLARAISVLGDAHPEDLANWDLRLSAAEKSVAAQALASLQGQPLMACGPGTKMQAKDWGQENWRALLTRLRARYPQHGLVLVGAREDGEAADYAGATWAGAAINLCGKLSPRQTAAVIERAAVFLGPDSGPMHLAASVAVPCVIAFSAAGRPGVWFPAGQHHQIQYHRTECHGCNLETCHAEARRCLTSITVEEMEAAVRRVLG